ncbi:MAG: hypothetical protein NC127_05735 [Muribaculum sp.]|nr:hypothetical protein [Muribaculum sp.]
MKVLQQEVAIAPQLMLRHEGLNGWFTKFRHVAKIWLQMVFKRQLIGCKSGKVDLVDSDFLTYLFESKCWYREVAEICVEGARNHGLLNMSVTDFFNMQLRIPSLNEQKEISKMMKSFTVKIADSQRLLSLYTEQRQFSLQKMFI